MRDVWVVWVMRDLCCMRTVWKLPEKTVVGNI